MLLDEKSLSDLLDELKRSISDLEDELKKLLKLWFLAGFIVTVISIFSILLISDLATQITELSLTVFIATLPFPFDLLVSYSIDPIQFVIELILQIVIFAVLYYYQNSS